ncbi:hypothetical protein GCM10009654_39050 [Streptomyces hebeiensis]|uniref:Lipoprotein n=2 Tax=Streptomyces hebeiensis TaxID=229486 RepID=A0ABN1UX82_9ACTN
MPVPTGGTGTTSLFDREGREPVNRRRATGLALVSLLPITLLTACATHGETSPRPTKPLTLPTAAPASAPFLELPFDAYRWTSRDDWSLAKARRTLLESCVAGRGVDFTMPTNIADERPPARYDNSRRYGVVDESTAAQFGYHRPVTDDERERRTAMTEWARRVSAEEEAAIYGEAETPGCYSEVDALLARGVPEADTDWLTERGVGTLRKTERSAEVVGAKERWRSCMSAAGYSYRTPDGAIGDPRWDLDSAKISALEVGTARADARCKRVSGLFDAWHAAEATAQARVIEENPEKFRALAANKRAHLTNVRNALAP